MSTDGMLTKGLKVLIALGDHPDGAGVSKLAREVGLPVSTTHRLLTAMLPLKFVRFDPEGRKYALGLKVFELSYQVSLVKDLSKIASPVMKKLAESTGEAVSLAVQDDEKLLYIAREEGPNRIRIKGTVGARGSLHCTSQGKALLAFLPEKELEQLLSQLQMEPRTHNTITNLADLRRSLEETRQRGYAVADQENEDEVRAIGVPLVSGNGECIAALSLVAPVYRMSREALEHFAPPLLKAAEEITIQLP